MTAYYRNGQKSAEIVSYGDAVGSIGLYPLGDPGTRYWHEDGRELTLREWQSFRGSEYLPIQMGFNPVETEAEWRSRLIDQKEERDRIEAEYDASMAAIEDDD